MKNKLLILVGVAALLAASCTKTNSAPNSNAHTTPPPTTSTNTLTSSGAESVLVGHWVFDSVVFYNNNVQTSSSLPSAGSSNNLVYDLALTSYGTGTTSAGKLNISFETVGGTVMSTYWFVTDHYLTSTGYMFLECGAPYLEGYIYTLTSSRLVTTPSTSTIKQGAYYYFHK